MIILVLLAPVVVAGVVHGIYNLITDSPTVSTDPQYVPDLLARIPVTTAGPILELGAGWGTLCFPLADRFPRARVVAYEISPIPFLVLRWLHWLQRRPNLEIRRQDFFQASFREASVVVCYLLPRAMVGLRPKFEAELPDGALVVSHGFQVHGWRPVAYDNDIKIFVYHLPTSVPERRRR